MSASLIVLIPVVLFGLVTVLCFIGCGLSTHGLGQGFGPYQDAIRKISNLIAFWPLDDQPSPDVSQPEAVDIAPKQPPLPPFTGFYMGPDGSFTLNNTGIVPGDFNNGLTPCASFNGGFVSVGFRQELNASSFTLECWVKPNWAAGDPQDFRAVVASAFGDPNPTMDSGFGLLATPDNFWTAQIGLGTRFLSATSTQAIMLDGVTTYYLAMSFDGSTLTLFVGIAGGDLTPTPPVSPNPGEKFLPESSGMTATSLFIGMGRPDLPTTMQNPFNGLIQDVAYYSPALGMGDIQNNFTLGSKPPG